MLCVVCCLLLCAVPCVMFVALVLDICGFMAGCCLLCAVCWLFVVVHVVVVVV